MIGKSVMLGLAVAGYAAASDMMQPPTFQQPATTYTTYQQPMSANERTNFGANLNAGYNGIDGGINTPFGDLGGNANFNLRPPTFANNNLLMGLIVFLGVLSFINIALTVVTPWISGLGGDDDGDDTAAEKNVEKGRRYQRNINMMADYVLNGIESFAKKNE